MVYNLDRKTLLASVDGTIKNVKELECSTWGYIDYLWLIEEPGTLTYNGEEYEFKEGGILIKLYSIKNEPAEIVFLPDTNLVNKMIAIKKARDEHDKCCCDCECVKACNPVPAGQEGPSGEVGIEESTTTNA